MLIRFGIDGATLASKKTPAPLPVCQFLPLLALVFGLLAQRPTLASGWKMVAPACSTGISGLTGPVYGFDGQDYTLPTTLAQGYGYWVLPPVDGEVAAKCSTFPVNPLTVALGAGFNLLGNPFEEPLPVGNLLGEGEAIFAFRGDRYARLEGGGVILPGEGVWWYSPVATAKTLFAVPGSGGGEVLSLVAVCLPPQGLTDAQRLVPGGYGCRPVDTSGAACPYAGPFEMWVGGKLGLMGVRAATGLLHPGCFAGSVSPVARADMALSQSQQGLLTLAAQDAPPGSYPWSFEGATVILEPAGPTGLEVFTGSDGVGLSANSLSVSVRAPLSVTAVAVCPAAEQVFDAASRATAAQACLALGGAVMQVARNAAGQLTGSLVVAVSLSDGTFDLLPLGQLAGADFDDKPGLSLSPAGTYLWNFTAGHAVDIALDVDGLTAYPLHLQEEFYDRIVVCPLTLLLLDPAIAQQYGPLSGSSLPPLPPLQMLTGGIIPSPPPAQPFTLPQSTLDLCAAAATPLSTSARLGQPVAFFAVGVGSGGARLLNLDAEGGWATPRTLAISPLPNAAGLVGIMPLESGDITPQNVGAGQVLALAITLARNHPATLSFSCFEAGDPPGGKPCVMQDGAVKLKRPGTLTVSAGYDAPTNNLWPDLPPFVGPLFITPTEQIGLSYGAPGTTHPEWPTATVQAVFMAVPTTTHELKTAVGDVVYTQNLLIEQGF